MQELWNKIIDFRDKREWKQFHKPTHLAKSISIEANELLEEYQWSDEASNIANAKEELADIMIYAILYAESIGVKSGEELIGIIDSKIKKNEKRFLVDKCKGKAK